MFVVDASHDAGVGKPPAAARVQSSPVAGYSSSRPAQAVVAGPSTKPSVAAGTWEPKDLFPLHTLA